MTKLVGTFSVRGTARTGFYLLDTCKFNNWGVVEMPCGGGHFKTFAAAASYALRCHEFKIGRRSVI